MNQSENNEGLGNLENLLGSLQSSGAMDNEFDRLQELLVKPDILRMRNQIAKLEQEFLELFKMGDKITKLEQEFPELWKMRDQIDNLEQELPELFKMGDKVTKLEQEFPELWKMRDQIDNLEQEFVNLKSKIDERENLVNVIVPLISELLNRKFVDFKQDILEALIPIIQEQTEEDKTLSIRLIGLSKESQMLQEDELLNE